MKRRIAKKDVRIWERDLADCIQKFRLSITDVASPATREVGYDLSFDIWNLVMSKLRLDPSSPFQKRWCEGISWNVFYLVKPTYVIGLGELWWGPHSNLNIMFPEPFKAKLRLESLQITGKVLYQIKLGFGSDCHHISNFKEVLTIPHLNADVDKRDGFGETALMQAAADGRSDEIKDLMRLGANTDLTSRTGFTALMQATMFKHEEVVQILLAHGADPNLITIDGYTPLMIAANFAHIDIVKLLLKAKAELNIRNKWGETALKFARMNDDESRPYTKIEELLRNAGAKE